MEDEKQCCEEPNYKEEFYRMCIENDKLRREKEALMFSLLLAKEEVERLKKENH